MLSLEKSIPIYIFLCFLFLFIRDQRLICHFGLKTPKSAAAQAAAPERISRADSKETQERAN
jgi:hypothetical protein